MLPEGRCRLLRRSSNTLTEESCYQNLHISSKDGLNQDNLVYFIDLLWSFPVQSSLFSPAPSCYRHNAIMCIVEHGDTDPQWLWMHVMKSVPIQSTSQNTQWSFQQNMEIHSCQISGSDFTESWRRRFSSPRSAETHWHSMSSMN